MKVFKKLMCLVVASACLNPICMGAPALQTPVDLQNVNDNVAVAPVSLGSQVFEVNTSREFSDAIKYAKASDIICLKSDITFDSSLNIDHSVCIDLNGHTVTMGDECKINIGKKTFSHVHTDKVWHEGRTVILPETQYDSRGHGRVRFKTEYEPGYYETSKKDIYNYDNGMEVSISNGGIRKTNGLDGEDGSRDVSRGYDGKNGKTPGAPINVISGTVRFSKVVVRGGNGGNGGKGGYQSLWHIPFGGGSAGNGGNGGNAGAAISKDSPEHGRCINVEDSSTFVNGKPGKGGEPGIPNPNYWIYRGWKGRHGNDGKAI